MGGMGSGRHGGRDLTCEYRQLDVRKLYRAGVLKAGYTGTWQWYRGGELRASVTVEATDASLMLRYAAASQGERKHFAYPVFLSWTACSYGGARPWFLCPGCSRRVAILYGGSWFVCRRCRQLAYQVQRETDNDRVIRRADTIRERLGWQPGILNGKEWKPKGMHWRTFWRLWNEYNELAGAGLDGMMQQLRSTREKLGRAERQLRLPRNDIPRIL